MNRILLIASALLFAASKTLAQETVSKEITAKGDSLYALSVEQYVREDSYSRPWERVMERDVLWKKRVLRLIDGNNERNEVFAAHTGDTKYKPLINILAEGVLSGKLKAYAPNTDYQFSQVLTKEQVVALLPGSVKNKPIANQQYIIKEDWLYTKSGKLLVRVIGLAPVKSVTYSGGRMSYEELFWMYFPDCREYLAATTASNGKNWDEVIENRDFNSMVVKVSNPSWVLPATKK